MPRVTVGEHDAREVGGLETVLRQAVRERVPVLAQEIAGHIAASGNPIFGSVEAVNGYVNIAFDSNADDGKFFICWFEHPVIL